MAGSKKIFMTSKNSLSKTVFGKLIQPLSGLIQQCACRRECNKLTDRQWIETGLLRVFSQERSGRAFLQKLFDSSGAMINRSHFFETLKSKRRLKLCRQIGAMLYEQLKSDHTADDPFGRFSELSGYDIYAGDGHYHAAAVHDVKKSGKKYPTQHFYSADLRTHALRHLTLADTGGGRKREHDTHALKRLDIETLRQGAPKGRKIIYVWDRAGIDFMQWFKWKHAGGIYFISREKENMRLQMLAELPYDKTNPVNAGVLGYDLVGTSAGVTACRVRYKCPLSGERYNFVTNLSNVLPGLIAYLYKTRWDIEKIFDEVKNKLAEKKAWATTETAKSMQAHFICLAHNLMLIFEDRLKKEGIKNKVEDKRRNKRLKKLLAHTDIKESSLPFYLKTPKRPTQRSVKFIRWLRNHLFTNTSWWQAKNSLERIYAVF
jgi:hypothetical protein